MPHASTLRHPLRPLLLAVVIIGSMSVPSLLHAQAFFGTNHLNLDSEAGPLLLRASFPNGEQLGTSSAEFGGIASGNVLSDQAPNRTWVVDTSGDTYAEGFSLFGGVTQVVTYGGGKVFTFPGFGPFLVSTWGSDLPLKFRGMNGPSAELTIRRTDYRELDDSWMYNYYTAIGLGDTWWVLRSGDLPFITQAGDSLLIGQLHKAWGIRTDRSTDSGAFRLVNLTTQADGGALSLEVEFGGTITCEPLETSGILPVALGNLPYELQIRMGGRVLLDTAVIPYPHMLVDIIVAPDGQGGESIRFVERLTSKIGRAFPRYWADAFQLVVFPSGELAGGTVRIADTEGEVRDVRGGLSDVEYFGVNLPVRRHTYDNVTVLDDGDRFRIRFDYREWGRDSATYMMLDRGTGIELYSYDEFDEMPQSLRRESLDFNPSGIPWKVGVASFAFAYDSLDVQVEGLADPIGTAPGWNSMHYGPITGSDIPYDVVEAPGSGISGSTPGEIVGSGVITGSPASFSMVLLDDDPQGGVRSLSYDVLPGTSSARLRLVNFADGYGPIGLTVKGNPFGWMLPPVTEGESEVVVIPIGTAVEYTVRNVEGDSLTSVVTSNGGSDNTFVIDGGAAEGELRVFGLSQLVPSSRYRMTVLRRVSLSTGAVSDEADAGIYRVAPNPMHGTGTLHLDATAPQPERLTLIDPLGRIVWEREVHEVSRETALDFGSLPTGVYSLIVRSRGLEEVRVPVVVW